MNGKKYPRDWELIDGYTQRRLVPGGWMVLHSTNLIVGGREIHASESMSFLPDPNHDWQLEDRA